MPSCSAKRRRTSSASPSRRGDVNGDGFGDAIAGAWDAGRETALRARVRLPRAALGDDPGGRRRLHRHRRRPGDAGRALGLRGRRGRRRDERHARGGRAGDERGAGVRGRVLAGGDGVGGAARAGRRHRRQRRLPAQRDGDRGADLAEHRDRRHHPDRRVTSTFTGPAGPAYTIPDSRRELRHHRRRRPRPAAGDRQLLHASPPPPRRVRPPTGTARSWRRSPPPATTKTWTLHVGDSFTDVPPSNALLPVRRDDPPQERDRRLHGDRVLPEPPRPRATRWRSSCSCPRRPPGYTPPACGADADVQRRPGASGFCRWIEELARRGVVGGCGGGNYCPTAPATREQMAVFVLRTLDPALDPPACGRRRVFADVPASSAFCRWIEELARRGVVTGCGGGNYCPTAAVSPASRWASSSRATFGLTLYGL